jgi:hypothetical protein
MKKLFTAILLAAVAFALILPGCGNQQPQVPAPAGPQGPAPLGPQTGPTAPGSHYEGGYLAGPGASYTFVVNAGNNTYIEVPFTYPVGSVDFWVKVVGQDGYTVLGDFDLDNGEIIQLSGGGTFYVTVYSKMGAGNWSATY